MPVFVQTRETRMLFKCRN